MSEIPLNNHSFLRFNVLFMMQYIRQNANVTVGYSTDMGGKKSSITLLIVLYLGTSEGGIETGITDEEIIGSDLKMLWRFK